MITVEDLYDIRIFAKTALVRVLRMKGFRKMKSEGEFDAWFEERILR